MIPLQSDERSIRTIRVDDEKLTKLLDTLDAKGTKADGKRKSPRYAYRIKSVRVYMQPPGSKDIVAYLVPTRNLSAGGLSFLHGGFVHQGTRCLVQLTRTIDARDDVPGTVVSCRYIEQMVHEVSVRFDRKIDPSAYCSAAM